MLLAACAGFGLSEPLRVNVVGLEPLEGQGMEARFAVKIRVQNPNDTPIEYDGVSVALDVRGSTFASGVSDARGVIPRYGEVVLTIPVSVPVSAIFNQVIELARGSDPLRTEFRLRGRLASPTLGGVRFESKGELALPGVSNQPR